jgi:hypothetical protein
LATLPVTFVRNQLLCDCCRSAYNDWQVQHSEWEKLPAELHTQNLCRDCYTSAVQAPSAVVSAPVRRVVRAVSHKPALMLGFLAAVVVAAGWLFWCVDELPHAVPTAIIAGSLEGAPV